MVHVLRWNFFKTLPTAQETTSDYVNRLVNLAVDCDFEHLSIKGAIMQNLLAHSMSPYLRQVVLDEELTIDQTITWTKKLEEKCEEEIDLLKMELKNQNSEEKCGDDSPKMEINDDQTEKLVKFDQRNEDVNDDHLDDLENHDQMDEDDYDDEPGEDFIRTSDSELQNVSNTDPLDYKCKVLGCNKEFTQQAGYKKHMNKCHIFKCRREDCQKQFKTRVSLLSHHRQQHYPKPTVKLDQIDAPDFKLVSSKRETANPGILTLQGYKLYCNATSQKKRDGQITYDYVCSEKASGYKCSATASLATVQVPDETGEDVSKNFLLRWPLIEDHSHDPDIGPIIMQEMITEMEYIVTNDPNRPLSNIKKEVIAEYKLKHATLWDTVLAELGKHKEDFIERKLRRIRQKLIGKSQLTLDDFDPSVRNLAETMIKEMKERVEADPNIQLLKVHDDVFNSYESQFGHQDIWPKVLLALGKKGSRLQRLRKVRTKLLGDVPTSMFIFSKSREKGDK